MIKPYEPIPTDAKICECKLYEIIGGSWMFLQRDIPEKIQCQTAIGYRQGYTTHLHFCGASKWNHKILEQILESCMRSLFLVT
ncbi:MAG: hypothetical protein WAM14_17330 [Candidatus Nitrosopolaris sp.]